MDSDLVAAFNLAEAGLWAAFALATAVLGHRVPGMTPRPRLGLSIAFLAFGVSDLIEVKTGARWRPPGLLAFKGACLASIAYGIWRIWRNRRVPAIDRSATDEV